MCASTEGAARGRGRHRVGAEDSAGAQVGDVGHADPGQGVDQVGLRGADAVVVLGAGAECASGSHPAIVRTAVGRRGAPEAQRARPALDYGRGMADDVEYLLLAHDLIARTERAVERVAHLAVDTGVTFSIDDIVDAVERELPAGYAAPTTGTVTRRDAIAQMAQHILSGEMYTGT